MEKYTVEINQKIGPKTRPKIEYLNVYLTEIFSR